jgi:hypothetical protein
MLWNLTPTAHRPRSDQPPVCLGAPFDGRPKHQIYDVRRSFTLTFSAFARRCMTPTVGS